MDVSSSRHHASDIARSVDGQGTDVRRSRRGSRWWMWATGILVAVVGGGTVTTLAAAAPAVVSVERDSVWTATVQHGEMIREVRARGRLVPEHVRWITVTTAGRLEQVHVRSGDMVKPDTVLFELNNPALQLELAQAQADLTGIRLSQAVASSASNQQLLAQQTGLAAARGEHAIAHNEAQALSRLGERGLVADAERHDAVAIGRALSDQLRLNAASIAQLRRDREHQSRMGRQHVSQLRSVVGWREQQLDGLRVRSGIEGAVQDVSVQEGQWVKPGEVLAKVADPTSLEAILDVPGAQARDVAVGQSVRIELSRRDVRGVVVRVAPSVQDGTVEVRVSFEEELPAGARPELLVQASIELEKIPQTLFVERPAGVAADQRARLFRIEPSSARAVATSVEFGVQSARTIEIRDGLDQGDEVIVSDMSKYQTHPEIELHD